MTLVSLLSLRAGIDCDASCAIDTSGALNAIAIAVAMERRAHEAGDGLFDDLSMIGIATREPTILRHVCYRICVTSMFDPHSSGEHDAAVVRDEQRRVLQRQCFVFVVAFDLQYIAGA
ncbi:hypothetical protein GCM10011487_21320 [Steroidobacter agaridevorans]|uniref:Uncharacterized protein n=1 Tax=Steroidobacter agaridevorans TaxID=2695856 RepID=A0A829YC03_9GAMM|nr:hypothetical protein GCM10011487_21320 [Steroidobacter agaridevorans]GFE89898.1 hypothetical protein GCM10011488_48520 [Steroidobacter agaridevorans]